MADISNQIQAIGQAKYGEEVREAIMDALTAMNTETIAAEEWATGGTGGTPGPDNNAKYFAEAAEAAQAAVAGLPSGYIRQKWLRGDGAASVDAGLKLNQSSRVICRFAATEYMEVGDRTGYLFGVRQNTGSDIFGFGQYAPSSGSPGTKWIPAYCTGSGVVSPSVSQFDLNWHTVDFNASKVYLDGNKIQDFDDLPSITVTDFETPSTVRIFGLYNNGDGSTTASHFFYSTIKLSECWIYQDGSTLSRHFIPARSTSDDEFGLYDLVGERFYVKESYGTGNLISGGDMTLAEVYDITSETSEALAVMQAEVETNGAVIDTYINPLPTAYKKLDYLRSNGTHFIDLGFLANQDTRVVCKFRFPEVTGNSEYLFGGRNTSTSETNSAYAFHQSNVGVLYCNYINGFTKVADSDDKIHVLDINKNILYLDGLEKVEFTSMTFSTQKNIHLFGVKTNSTDSYGICCVYYMLVYDNDTLIRDLVPCERVSDSVFGMYDRVNGVFYAMESGLTAGNDATLDGLSGKIDEVENDVRDAERIVTDVNALKAEVFTKDYIQAEADRVAEAVRNVQTGRTLTMLAVSDIHYNVDDPVIQVALEDMKAGIINIARQVHIDYFASFGDITYRLSTGGNGNFEKGKAELISATKILTDCFGIAPQLRIVGNHDPDTEQSGYYLTNNQLNAFFGIYNTLLEKVESAASRGYGFMDIERQKIRVIVLNTSWYSEPPTTGQTVYGFGKAQADFLRDTLYDLNDKENAASWKVIILSHIRLDDTGHTTIAKYANILTAYEEGTSYPITISGNDYNYDFTGRNAAPIVLYINGHTHLYGVDNIGKVNKAGSERLSNLRIGQLYIPNGLPERDGASIDGVVYRKTAGTAESTAFQVVTLDTDNGVLYAHHYGAGFDIIYHYGSAEAETGTELTTALEDAEWTSRDETVATVSNGVITAVASGNVTVYARETETVDETVVTKRIEAWNLAVTA